MNPDRFKLFVLTLNWRIIVDIDFINKLLRSVTINSYTAVEENVNQNTEGIYFIYKISYMICYL